MITAFVIGSECEYALGAASKNALYERGWWTTGVLGPVGASMAAARLLRLDAAKTRVQGDPDQSGCAVFLPCGAVKEIRGGLHVFRSCHEGAAGLHQLHQLDQRER